MPDLSDGVNWSQTDANNNNASPNGWPEGMMPSGVNDAARADRGALKRFWDKINPVQNITSAGGVYTFVTDNLAYPAAYVPGELYCFTSHGPSVGGELFQVNALPAKPIWKRIVPGSTGVGPIVAQDIVGSVAAQLIYDASLNGGTGVFVLLNPHLPIVGDGGGGASVPLGGFTVNGPLKVATSTPFAAYLALENTALSPATAGYWRLWTAGSGGHFNIHKNTSPLGDFSTFDNVFGILATDYSATFTGSVTSGKGYGSRSGVSGPSQNNLYNIQWDGSAAHLWIDTTDVGPIVTSSGGSIAIGGNVSTGSLSTTGDITDGGNLRVNGNGASSGGVSIYATSGAIRSDVSGTALYLPNGNVVCQGITAAGDYSGHSITASGGITVSAGGLNVASGGLSVNGLSSLYDITAHNISAYGGIVVTAGGLNVQSGGLNVTGNSNVSGTAQMAYAVIGNDHVTGPLQVDGTSGFTGNALFGGNVNIGGNLYGNPGGYLMVGSTIYPITNNTYSIGYGGLAWQRVTAYLHETVSDPVFKRDIEPAPAGCLDLVRLIKPKTYKFKSRPEDETDNTHWGFMAPEIAAVMSKAGRRFDAVREENGVSLLAYNELIAVLWKAVQELAERTG